MEIYYLHHSAIAIVLNKSLFVFDHFMNDGRGLLDGSVSDDDLKAAQSVYVFASHSHYDHYNKGVLEWAKVNQDTTYILDSTIVAKEEKANIVTLSPGGEFDDGYIYVREFGSTDEGGSFYVRCEGTSFFHAGDLNLWHWRDDGDERYTRLMGISFERKMRDIRDNISEIDYAFFPVDSRIGSGYDEGADMFIDIMKPKVFVPIHMNGFEDARAYSEKQFEGTQIINVYKNGQRLV